MDFPESCRQLQENIRVSRRELGASFKFVSVEAFPDRSMIIHAMPIGGWERDETPQDRISAMIGEGALADVPYEVRLYPLGVWPRPMEETSFERFPMLIARRTPEGGISGVWGWELRIGSVEEAVAARAVEPGEAAAFIDTLRAGLVSRRDLPGFFRQAPLDAASLEDAYGQMPASAADQRSVLIYEQDEWVSGLHNGPGSGHPGTWLGPVATYHDVPVAQAKLAARKSVEDVAAKITLTGSYPQLLEALALIEDRPRPRYGGFEDHPALRLLCTWWNRTAPAEYRTAGTFRIYIWNENTRVFAPGDPEEPPLQASAAAELKGTALFRESGAPTVLVHFIRGREYDQCTSGGISIYDTSGELVWEVGSDRHEYDEAYYAYVGLESLAQELNSEAEPTA